MGWERRGRGGLYYTRSRRVNGRIVQEYVGTGLVAELAARLDAEERAGRRACIEAARAERRRLDEADAQISRLCELADALSRSALLLAGYRQHDRGEWRRRHGQERAAD